MMKKVYICSRLCGNIELNIYKVKIYTKYAHFYAMCIDDSVPKNREIGICAGLSLLWFCDEMWVFGDEITEGMQREINFCKNLNIRVVYISDETVNKKIGGKSI